MHVKEEYREEMIVKKSRFIACVKRINSEIDARKYIEEIQKEFHDASHVCTAFLCGKNNEIQRSSDNGEPSGTAGVPILESIKKSEVTDVCVCVVRYFGGIKLGAGGLIRAYAGIATLALTNAPKTKVIPLLIYNITYSYDLVGTIESYLRKNGTILATDYNESVTTAFSCDATLPLKEEIQNLSKARATVTCIEKTYGEMDLE